MLSPFRFMLTIDLYLCQSLLTSLVQLILFLVRKQIVTMGSLFQVSAGEGNQTWLLLLIRVGV